MHAYLHPVPSRNVNVTPYILRQAFPVFAQPEHRDDAPSRMSDEHVYNVTVFLREVCNNGFQIYNVIIEPCKMPLARCFMIASSGARRRVVKDEIACNVPEVKTKGIAREAKSQSLLKEIVFVSACPVSVLQPCGILYA